MITLFLILAGVLTEQPINSFQVTASWLSYIDTNNVEHDCPNTTVVEITGNKITVVAQTCGLDLFGNGFD